MLLVESKTRTAALIQAPLDTFVCPSRSALLCCMQSAAVLDAELTKHKAANAGIERDVARFKEREAIHKKVLCIKTRLPYVTGS